MKLNEKKDKIQTKAKLEYWKHKRCTIAMCTGSGKTKVGIDISLEYTSVLIVVPTEKLRDVRWEEEYKKWECLDFYKNIRRECYASLHKIDLNQFDLIILDEAHNCTPNNTVNFDSYKGDILGLTATPPRDDDKKEIFKKYFPVVFYYSLDEGVKDEVVAPYSLNLVSFPLDTKKTYNVKTKFKDYYTSEKDRYRVLSRVVSECIFDPKRDAKFPILNRARFLYTLPSKIRYARLILKKYIKDQRCLIFTGGIEHTKKLCQYTFHSKSNDTDYNKFIKGKINQLATVHKLDEGEDIELLDTALITKITSNELSLIQRIGRIVRIREDHVAKIWIIYSEGTQEEKWLAKSISKLDQTKINWFKISEL